MSQELDIIQTIAHCITQGTEAENPLSDDAFWDPDTREIFTTDLLVEGQHFSQAYFSPFDIGWKAAAVNISDIAAMGGSLKYLLVSLGLPPNTSLEFIDTLYQGLQAATKEFNGKIIGGDTVGAQQLILNVTAIGYLPKAHTLGTRNGAQPGDIILLSGFPGLSAVGLQAFQQHVEGYPQAKAAHLHPEPQLEQGLALSKKCNRYALMDTSDGLADALIKVATQSGVCLEIDAQRVPLHPELLAWSQNHTETALNLALYGGEDFGLLATVPPEQAAHFPEMLPIGYVMEGPPQAQMKPLDSGPPLRLLLEKTYQHFL